jgi:SulP family sulfate permease
MSPLFQLYEPKLFTVLRRGYGAADFRRDLIAGLTVAIVALPLSMALAIASGTTPDKGLHTAIVAGFLISFFGGSRVQIGGPTAAFVPVVFNVIEKFGYGGLILCTLLAGAMLILAGVLRVGTLMKYIPKPVITGFTAGIAVSIFSSQVKDLLGLSMDKVPAEFFARWSSYAEHISTTTPAAAVLAAAALAIIVILRRTRPTWPGFLIAVIFGALAVALFGAPVETIGTRFGGIPAALPSFEFPHIPLERTTELFPSSFTIAFLAGVESLLSAVVADGMIGGRHRSNMELVAQGVANLVSPLFGGIPATGAIARTATNIKNGARTPIAGMVHALTLLLITLVFGRWAALIPMATLAAILVVVSYHMSEWRSFLAELRSPKSDVAVLLTTFLLTVLVDLTVAIEVGMVLAAFLFIRRMAEVTNVNVVTADDEEDRDGVGRARIPAGVEVYEVNGPFFFGAAETFKETIGQISTRPRVLIIRMRDVPALDSSGMHALKDVVHRSRREGTEVLLSEVRPQPRAALEGSVVFEEIGAERIYDDFDEALAAARHLVDAPRPALVSR